MKVAAAALLLALAPSPSDACSPVEPKPFELDPAQADDTTPPTPLVFCEYFTSYTKPGDPATCGGLGHFHVIPDNRDDITAPEDLGYTVQLDGGPEEPARKLLDDTIWIRFDANADSVLVGVTIRSVDLNGNKSEPQRCRLSWTNPEPETGGGCAATPGGGGLALGFVLLALRRRRATPA